MGGLVEQLELAALAGELRRAGAVADGQSLQLAGRGLVAGALQAARRLPARRLPRRSPARPRRSRAARRRAARAWGCAGSSESGLAPMSKNLGRCRSRRAPGCAAGLLGRLARDVGVDGDGGPAAGGDGLHHRGRAGLAVASGEDALSAGEQRQLVGFDGAPGGEGTDLGQVVAVDLLPQGQDHRVGGHGELRARRSAAVAAGRCRPARPGPSSGRPPRRPCRASRDRDRRGKEQEFGAFFLGLVDLVGGGRHLLPRAPVGHRHLRRPPDGARNGPRPWP